MRTPMLDQLLTLACGPERALERIRSDPRTGGQRPHRRRAPFFSTNLTLQDSVMMVYARWATSRTLDGMPVVTLDLASVRVKDRLRGRGHFTELLAELVAHAEVDAVYVENVHNARLAARLARDGWTVFDPAYFAPSFWRWTACRAARGASDGRT